jgi:hypothetical protein
MLRRFWAKLWPATEPTSTPAPEPAAAPKIVDKRTALDRAIARNPNLIPKGMTAADFALWCEEINESHEAAAEFYVETLCLMDPAEAKKIAADHASEEAASHSDVARPTPARPGPAHPHDPGPAHPGPARPGPTRANVTNLHEARPGPARPTGPPVHLVPRAEDVVDDFVKWMARRVHPQRGYSGSDLVKLYRSYCEEADLEPMKREPFLNLLAHAPGIQKSRARDGKVRERRWHLPTTVKPIKKVA